MTVNDAKQSLILRLEAITDSPLFEANEIIIAALKINRSDLILCGKNPITKADKRRIDRLFKKRKKGVPLQYLLGEWEFYSLPFKVGQGVLIPRGDTELLVDLALDELEHIKGATVFDLCAGSGAIGIALQKNDPSALVTLVEKSKKAFKYLTQNAALNNSPVKFIRANIFKWRPKHRADMVICNPPYITKNEMKSLQKEVKNEPRLALFGGNDGLKYYKFLTQNAGRFLKSGGKMLVEIGAAQADDVLNLFKANGFEDVKVFKDINQNDRVVLGTFNS